MGGGGVGREGPYDRGGEIRGRAVPRTGQDSARRGIYLSPITEVEYPLLRACSSSAALRAAGLHTHVRILRACSSSAAVTAAGLHTHVRTHRTSSDPAYLIKSGLFVHFRGKKNVAIFRV